MCLCCNFPNITWIKSQVVINPCLMEIVSSLYSFTSNSVIGYPLFESSSTISAKQGSRTNMGRDMISMVLQKSKDVCKILRGFTHSGLSPVSNGVVLRSCIVLMIIRSCRNVQEYVMQVLDQHLSLVTSKRILRNWLNQILYSSSSTIISLKVINQTCIIS